MASIKISDLTSQIFASDLIDSELKNIQGGYCREGTNIYPEGSVVMREDGKLYECVDGGGFYSTGSQFQLYKG